MNPLPLYPGAEPCVGSGFCCKRAPCPFGEGTPCVHLTPAGDDRYRCGIAEEIMRQPGWEMAPAFGAGCCSSLFNPDRDRILREMKEDAMETNRRLATMETEEQHAAICEAIRQAQLQEMIPCRWSCEDHEGCDTPTMIRVVCLEQMAEKREQLPSAIAVLQMGHAPRGATPYPDAAEQLALRRGVA